MHPNPLDMPVVPLRPELLFLRSLQQSLRTPKKRRLPISPTMRNHSSQLLVIGYLLWLWVVIHICFYLYHWWIIQWCSGCQDGGELVICTNCNTITICTLCIDFRIKDGFKCPPCFKKQNKPVPYVCFVFNFLLINIHVDIAMEISGPWCW